LLAILLFFGCSKIKVNTQEAITAQAIVNIPGESGTIGSIDIPAPDYFFMLRPWKKGTLVTMDEKARFAELSFVGDSRIKIKALVDFPMERIDPVLRTAPEAGIIVTQSGAQKHVADISTGKTKSFTPLNTWRYSEGMPNIFNPTIGLVRFSYYRERNVDDRLPWYNIIFDPKNDKTVYQSPEIGEDISFNFPFTDELVLTLKRNGDDTQEFIFYNWRTREITRNELTKKYTLMNLYEILRHDYNINIMRRFSFADIGVYGEVKKKIKLTWNENYEDVTVISLDYLIPKGLMLNDFVLSADGKWATTFISGYEGLRGELLVKRAFFHLDNRYPNEISMPVIINEYDDDHPERGSFVEHPVYGWCFADRKDINEKRYLRLYKMSDVLAEIERLMVNGVEENL